MSGPSQQRPNWDDLYGIASVQEGFFTTKQAVSVGYSYQLLDYYIRAKMIVRVRRGIYRLVYFPQGEYEDFVVAWLWSDQAGIVSHQTALCLHGFSDILPAKIHLTLPQDWKKRRYRVPAGMVLHFSQVSSEEQSWLGPIPITKPARTLNDCAIAGVSPEIVQQAARQAIQRGIVSMKEISKAVLLLEPFGGV